MLVDVHRKGVYGKVLGVQGFHLKSRELDLESAKGHLSAA